MDGAVQLRLLMDEYFEMQLKQVVRLLSTRQGKQRYNGMDMQVIDLPQRHGKIQEKRVDATCWQILLTDDYFIDSTNHLLVVRKGGIGILMRINWHHMSPTEVLDLFGKLHLMDCALQRS